jgi:caffeoyl-CoA O-methyltransferase
VRGYFCTLPAGSISMTKTVPTIILTLLLLFAGFPMSRSADQKDADSAASDARIRKVIANHRSSWEGMNVPEADGQALHDIVLQHGYKNALEIGTSNGYSGLWIAWALSKTGGKLITIELDRGRHEEAVACFRDAGLSKYVDARLGDAHEIVPALSGSFDFVFCDADKEWYENYLKAALPKISVGGCFAAHNVSDPSLRGRGGFRRGFGGGMSGGFFEYAKSLSNLETSILNIPGSGGLSVSFKKSK